MREGRMKGSPWTRMLCAPSLRDQGVENNSINEVEKRNSLRSGKNKGTRGMKCK